MVFYNDHEDLYVTIDSAQWRSKEIHDLLVEAVSRAAKHAAWGPSSGEQFMCDDGENTLESFTSCNMPNRISVSLPGNSFMNVRFQSSSEFGEYNCGSSLNTAAGYLTQDLLGQMQTAVGDNDLFVMSTCLYSLDR